MEKRLNLQKHLENLSVNPNGFAENYNLGIVFHHLGKLQRAKKFFKRAITIKPHNPLAYNDLGTVYLDLSKPKLAYSYFKKAIKLNPKFSDAYYNIGFLYSQYKSKANLAKSYYIKAYRLDAGHSRALAMYYQSIRGSCNFRLKEKLSQKLDKLTNRELESRKDVGEAAFLHLSRKADEEENFKVAKSWCAKLSPKGRPASGWQIPSTKILKIGYMSDGLRDFPTGHNLSGVISEHSKNINVSIYTWGKPDNSLYEKKIKKRADNYVDIHELSDLEAAARIYNDKLDILIDLKGFTKDNRIGVLANRPAPIQINYLGYPGTTGSHFHDYLIADKVVIPPKNKKYFTEKIIYLKHCYRPADVVTQVSLPATPTAKSHHLPGGQRVVFASLNSAYKIDREIFNAWLEILESVENSELWILAESNETRENLKHPGVRFLDFTDKKTHLERLGDIDLCLDTTIVSGHTTTTDAARMGVPTLCLAGQHFASRVSASVSAELGLNDLVCNNLAEYKDVAIRFTQDKKFRNNIYNTLARGLTSSVIFNPNKFAKSLEKVYFSVYKHE